MSRPVDPKAVEAAFKAVQTAIAGHDVTCAARALLDALSIVIAMGAPDQETALKLVDSVQPMLRYAVIANWDQARYLRERAAAHARPGPSRLQ